MPLRRKYKPRTAAALEQKLEPEQVALYESLPRELFEVAPNMRTHSPPFIPAKTCQESTTKESQTPALLEVSAPVAVL